MLTARTLPLVIALIAAPALAAPPAPKPMQSYMVPMQTSVLSAESIDAACDADPGATDTPACASFELNTHGYKRVTLIIRYTRDAATTVTMSKDSSVDGAPPWGVLQIGSAAPPVVTMTSQQTTWDVSAIGAGDSVTWEVTFDVTGPYTRFRLEGASASADDVVTVNAVLIGG